MKTEFYCLSYERLRNHDLYNHDLEVVAYTIGTVSSLPVRSFGVLIQVCTNDLYQVPNILNWRPWLCVWKILWLYRIRDISYWCGWKFIPSSHLSWASYARMSSQIGTELSRLPCNKSGCFRIEISNSTPIISWYNINTTQTRSAKLPKEVSASLSVVESHSSHLFRQHF